MLVHFTHFVLTCGVRQDALNAESNALLRNAEPQFKENDELFFVDKKGSALKVGRKDAWELKCNSILKPNEKIEARKVFRSGKKKNTIQERIDQFAEEIREHGSVVSRKRRSDSAPQASERSFDLWGDAGESKNEVRKFNDDAFKSPMVVVMDVVVVVVVVVMVMMMKFVFILLSHF